MNWRRSVLWCVALSILFSVSVLAEEDRSIVIRGIEGHGTSRQLALADAFRNAIGQALGTYVVTSRQWDGETLDKKIFDNSDAVVKSHQVVAEKESDGRWAVTIDAEIVRNEMMKYIRKETTAKVGEGELANLLAKRNAINNAVQSLELLFQNWRENIYRAEKYGSLSISANDKVGSDVVHVSVPFIITFRWDVYGIFLDKVRNVLSRIAIDKTQGEYEVRSDGDFRKKNYSFYSRVGLAYNEHGYIETRNPNNYGEIRIISTLTDTRVAYEIYIVPCQVKEAMDSLLKRKAEIRCSFTSKGGEIVSSSSITGEVYSFGWDDVCDDDVGLGWSDHSGPGLITIMNVIKTKFDGDKWSTRRLYHASIPVLLDAASRISGCTLTICPSSEKDDRLYGYRVITSEIMNEDEWSRIDKRPQIVTSRKKVPLRSSRQKATSSEQGRSIVKPEPLHDNVGIIRISEKDKKLKDRVVELSLLPPDFSSAGKWFLLAKEIESDELRQLALKASGAALVYAKKQNIYNLKVKPLIKNASEFEKSLYMICPSCEGKRTIDKKCKACGGNGVCRYSNCNNGKRLVHDFGGNHYKDCRDCKGSGECQKCGATGMLKTKCLRCNGKGISFDLDMVDEVYHKWLEAISRSFND